MSRPGSLFALGAGEGGKVDRSTGSKSGADSFLSMSPCGTRAAHRCTRAHTQHTGTLRTEEKAAGRW